MRLWTRIRQASSRAFSNVSSKRSKTSWQRLGRRRLVPPDLDAGLIRDLLAKGTPMSLASLKAALDVTASVQDAKRPDVHGMKDLGIKSLGISAIGSSFTILVG